MGDYRKKDDLNYGPWDKIALESALSGYRGSLDLMYHRDGGEYDELALVSALDDYRKKDDLSYERADVDPQDGCTPIIVQDRIALKSELDNNIDSLITTYRTMEDLSYLNSSGGADTLALMSDLNDYRKKDDLSVQTPEGGADTLALNGDLQELDHKVFIMDQDLSMCRTKDDLTYISNEGMPNEIRDNLVLKSQLDESINAIDSSCYNSLEGIKQEIYTTIDDMNYRTYPDRTWGTEGDKLALVSEINNMNYRVYSDRSWGEEDNLALESVVNGVKSTILTIAEAVDANADDIEEISSKLNAVKGEGGSSLMDWLKTGFEVGVEIADIAITKKALAALELKLQGQIGGLLSLHNADMARLTACLNGWQIDEVPNVGDAFEEFDEISEVSQETLQQTSNFWTKIKDWVVDLWKNARRTHDLGYERIVDVDVLSASTFDMRSNANTRQRVVQDRIALVSELEEMSAINESNLSELTTNVYGEIQSLKNKVNAIPDVKSYRRSEDISIIVESDDTDADMIPLYINRDEIANPLNWSENATNIALKIYFRVFLECVERYNSFCMTLDKMFAQRFTTDSSYNDSTRINTFTIGSKSYSYRAYPLEIDIDYFVLYHFLSSPNVFKLHKGFLTPSDLNGKTSLNDINWEPTFEIEHLYKAVGVNSLVCPKKYTLDTLACMEDVYQITNDFLPKYNPSLDAGNTFTINSNAPSDYYCPLRLYCKQLANNTHYGIIISKVDSPGQEMHITYHYDTTKGCACGSLSINSQGEVFVWSKDRIWLNANVENIVKKNLVVNGSISGPTITSINNSISTLNSSLSNYLPKVNPTLSGTSILTIDSSGSTANVDWYTPLKIYNASLPANTHFGLIMGISQSGEKGLYITYHWSTANNCGCGSLSITGAGDIIVWSKNKVWINALTSTEIAKNLVVNGSITGPTITTLNNNINACLPKVNPTLSGTSILTFNNDVLPGNDYNTPINVYCSSLPQDKHYGITIGKSRTTNNAIYMTFCNSTKYGCGIGTLDIESTAEVLVWSANKIWLNKSTIAQSDLEVKGTLSGPTLNALINRIASLENGASAIDTSKFVLKALPSMTQTLNMTLSASTSSTNYMSFINSIAPNISNGVKVGLAYGKSQSDTYESAAQYYYKDSSGRPWVEFGFYEWANVLRYSYDQLLLNQNTTIKCVATIITEGNLSDYSSGLLLYAPTLNNDIRYGITIGKSYSDSNCAHIMFKRVGNGTAGAQLEFGTYNCGDILNLSSTGIRANKPLEVNGDITINSPSNVANQGLKVFGNANANDYNTIWVGKANNECAYIAYHNTPNYGSIGLNATLDIIKWSTSEAIINKPLTINAPFDRNMGGLKLYYNNQGSNNWGRMVQFLSPNMNNSQYCDVWIGKNVTDSNSAVYIGYYHPGVGSLGVTGVNDVITWTSTSINLRKGTTIDSTLYCNYGVNIYRTLQVHGKKVVVGNDIVPSGETNYLSVVDSSMANGTKLGICLGKAWSAYNCGFIHYYYKSAGSTDNHLAFAVFGDNDTLQIYRDKVKLKAGVDLYCNHIYSKTIDALYDNLNSYRTQNDLTIARDKIPIKIGLEAGGLNGYDFITTENMYSPVNYTMARIHHTDGAVGVRATYGISGFSNNVEHTIVAENTANFVKDYCYVNRMRYYNTNTGEWQDTDYVLVYNYNQQTIVIYYSDQYSGNNTCPSDDNLKSFVIYDVYLDRLMSLSDVRTYIDHYIMHPNSNLRPNYMNSEDVHTITNESGGSRKKVCNMFCPKLPSSGVVSAGLYIGKDTMNIRNYMHLDYYWNNRICFELYQGESNLGWFEPNGLHVNGRVYASSSTTITHFAPIEALSEDLDLSKLIGKPCFMSGKVYNKVTLSAYTDPEADPNHDHIAKYEWREIKDHEEMHQAIDSADDCISSVVFEGTCKTYLGIITQVDPSNRSLYFATHGDFFVHINASNAFSVGDHANLAVGDTIYIQSFNPIKYAALDDDTPLTNTIKRSTIGVITKIMDGCEWVCVMKND